MLEKQHENFVAAVRKWEMLAVTTLKVSGCKKKGNTNTYDISSIKRVTRNFWEFYVVVVSSNGRGVLRSGGGGGVTSQ